MSRILRVLGKPWQNLFAHCSVMEMTNKLELGLESNQRLHALISFIHISDST